MLALAPQSVADDMAARGPESNALIERWYAQVGSLASFMINQGGTLGFSIFIGRLKAGDTADAAIGAAFPGLWRNMGDLERAWLLHIKG
jgi:hypothetical protein